MIGKTLNRDSRIAYKHAHNLCFACHFGHVQVAFRATMTRTFYRLACTRMKFAYSLIAPARFASPNFLITRRGQNSRYTPRRLTRVNLKFRRPACGPLAWNYRDSGAPSGHSRYYDIREYDLLVKRRSMTRIFSVVETSFDLTIRYGSVA